MAVSAKSNENSESRKKFLGMCDLYIEAINPSTVEQVKKLGYNFTEVNYHKKVTKADGTEVDSVRIDFFMSNKANEDTGEPKVNLIHSFTLLKSQLVSSTGKKQFINEVGIVTWLDDVNDIPENLNWFKVGKIRAAYTGEEQLMEFIKSFANVSKGDSCVLETISSFFTGNFSELHNMLQGIPNNTVKLNLTIRKVQVIDEETGQIKAEKFYQSAFNRKSERPYSTDMSFMKIYVEDFIANSTRADKIIFAEYPYVFTEFTGINPDTEASNAQEESANAGSGNW